MFVLRQICSFKTATQTQRRAARRARANARLAWRLNKLGIVPLSKPKLALIRTRLQSHHSKDTLFLRHIVSAMDLDKVEPWKCYQCKRVCSGYHQFCGKCGQSWELCADPAFVPPKRGQRSVQWNYHSQPADQWETSDSWTDNQWIQSPRRRQSPRQRSRKKSKGEKGSKGKGLGKSSDDQPSFGPPALPSHNSSSSPWMAVNGLQSTASPSIPSPLPSDMKEDKEKDRQIGSLVAALRKQ